MFGEVLNLLHDSWLPGTRRSGRGGGIRPAQITEGYADDPVMEIAWPRPDFRIAAIEFLIGLFSTFVPRPDEPAWREWWRAPPSPGVLDAALVPNAHAFTLDGDGPRFMQDFDPMENGSCRAAEMLLIEAPGEETRADNRDLLVKRDRVTRLSRPAAAMALFTLQAYAPGGGQGHRVGLRGGGPLTTLIVPEGPEGGPPTLWQLIWANVQPGKPVSLDRLSRVLPWLAPTPTSENDKTALAAGLEPAHAFWGMPRRIRLDFAPNPDQLSCDLTGETDAVVVTGWRTRPHGIFYQSWTPPHPLSPYYQTKKTELPVAQHGQPTGAGYLEWVGLVVEDKDGNRRPAGTVSHFREQRALQVSQRHPRLLAAGYDIYNNNKIRGFVESEMPLPPPIANRAALDDRICALVRGARVAADAVQSEVRRALFSPGTTIKIASATPLTTVRERFWRETAAAFHARVNFAVEQLETDPDPMREPLTRPWLNTLREVALRCFDESAPLDPDQFRDAADDTGQRIVRARGFLSATLAGYGKNGKELFEVLKLTLPPETTKPKKAKRSE